MMIGYSSGMFFNAPPFFFFRSFVWATSAVSYSNVLKLKSNGVQTFFRGELSRNDTC